MVRKRSGDRALWRWEGRSLINKTGLAMDLEGGSQQPGARVLGWDHHGQINQQWRMEGKYLRCEGNSLVLDIPGSDMNTGARVKAWSKNNPSSSNQMWNLEPGRKALSLKLILTLPTDTDSCKYLMVI